MIYHVTHPDHDEVETVSAEGPRGAAKIAVERGNQETVWTGVMLTVYASHAGGDITDVTVPSQDDE